MADQYGLTPEDYIYDNKFLSYQHYSQGMLFLILSSLKQRLKSFYLSYPSKPYLQKMVPHISSLLGSVPSPACFPFKGQLLPLTYEN